MKNKYEIEKDPYLNIYIVWEIHRNYRVDIFKGFKYECEEWLNEKEKKVCA